MYICNFSSFFYLKDIIFVAGTQIFFLCCGKWFHSTLKWPFYIFSSRNKLNSHFQLTVCITQWLLVNVSLLPSSRPNAALLRLVAVLAFTLILWLSVSTFIAFFHNIWCKYITFHYNSKKKNIKPYRLLCVYQDPLTSPSYPNIAYCCFMFAIHINSNVILNAFSALYICFS